LKITIKVVKELPDGSADVELDYDQEALEFMIERGINALLVEAIMTEQTGELYGISDILGTLPKKGGKRRSNKSVAKIKSGGTD
jgi:hypothetical protein